MRRDGDFIVRLTGVAFAVLANLFLVWLLLNDRTTSPDLQEADESPLQVRWIEAKTPEMQAVEQPIVKSPKSQRPKKTPSVREIEVQPQRSEVGDAPLPSAESASPSRLDLTLRDAGMLQKDLFEPSVLSRPKVDALDRELRVKVEVRDRSVGGRLQRMAGQSACNELRQAAAAAARAGGGSQLDIIAKSMRERGCN